jgi:transcription initiation factor TFIIH subunit 2
MNLDKDEPEYSSYQWEKSNSSLWESVQEDDEGRIIVLSNERERSYRSKLRRITKSVRRGLIRYLIVAIDCSLEASEKDMKPNRLEVIKSSLKKFIREYFDQNPISQLSIVITRDRVAEVVTELTGNIYVVSSYINGIQCIIVA